jgi:hypothetical protein
MGNWFNFCIKDTTGEVCFDLEKTKTGKLPKNIEISEKFHKVLIQDTQENKNNFGKSN